MQGGGGRGEGEGYLMSDAAVARMSAACRKRYLEAAMGVRVILLLTAKTKEVKMKGLDSVMSFSGLISSSYRLEAALATGAPYARKCSQLNRLS
jgi:hypothetical protein